MTVKEIEDRLQKMEEEYKKLIYDLTDIDVAEHDYDEEELQEEIDALDSCDRIQLDNLDAVNRVYRNLKNALSGLESGDKKTVHNGKKQLEEALSCARDCKKLFRDQIENAQNAEKHVEEIINEIKLWQSK